MQQLQLNLTVQVPDDHVLVKKVEYDELQNERLSGRNWTMEDLEKRTARKQLWLRTNVLYVPRFKKELEKFVHYPSSQGDKWSFHAVRMAKFIDDNYYLIFECG
ncbi:DUF771 domain-containing protein [Lysinibacillus sphaericus]|uniref:DUF771 domain-containing protein n=1 Tax=Lysinibacillus sphaericus TaxID=1421 RepID=UPI003CFD2C74